MAEPIHFQWQNEVLVKTIYPMRETKLRDFLVYYEEVDRWAEYKNKDFSADVPAYKESRRLAAVAGYKEYSTLLAYFKQADVRGNYSKFKPIDEAELTEINNLHAAFISSWPKDIRGERDFVTMYVNNLTQHRNLHRDWVKSRERRHESMDPNHPKYASEGQELDYKKTVTLPMAEQELAQLRAFLATYDKVEKRKLEWYQLKKKDPKYAVDEAEYLVQAPEQPPTVYEIVDWKIEAYKTSLDGKNQYELLDMIYQRFKKEPKRFPFWLQYMIVHFSGMRYASAHGSWADPKDLIIRLRVAKANEELEKLDAAAIQKLSAEKVAAYEGASRPKLALAPEKEWKDKVAVNLGNLKTNSAQGRKYGLSSMQADEIAHEVKSMTTEKALETIKSMKADFPGWAWKEIVKLTPLRLTEVTDPNWEKLTPEEEEKKNAEMSKGIGKTIMEWENYDTSAWREEHGRTHELIVSRAVCNETAEHCQHIRGHLPPGGLTPKPKWYQALEKENKIPGEVRPYFTKPASEKDYIQGASVLWLRFVNNKPDLASQAAKPVETKNKFGLLPPEFTGKKKAAGKNDTGWTYVPGEIITRTRTLTDANKVKTTQLQYLRWIHEATVAEVAETAEGKFIITYETALPGGDEGTSCIGIFRNRLDWFLSDGTEEEYNRSFVGYAPEGQPPTEHLKVMLDWNKILRRKVG